MKHNENEFDEGNLDNTIVRVTCPECEGRVHYDDKPEDVTTDYIKCPTCGRLRDIQLVTRNKSDDVIMQNDEKTEYYHGNILLFTTGYNETYRVDVDNFKTYPYDLLMLVYKGLKFILGDVKPPLNSYGEKLNSVVETIEAELESRKSDWVKHVNDVMVNGRHVSIVCKILLLSKIL